MLSEVIASDTFRGMIQMDLQHSRVSPSSSVGPISFLRSQKLANRYYTTQLQLLVRTALCHLNTFTISTQATFRWVSVLMQRVTLAVVPHCPRAVQSGNCLNSIPFPSIQVAKVYIWTGSQLHILYLLVHHKYCNLLNPLK